MNTVTRLMGIMVAILTTAACVATGGVVADYHFDTSGAVAVDSSGNGNNGTLVGFTNLSSGYADNSDNPGYTSDGKLRLIKGGEVEYVESGVTSSFLTESFTIEAITGLHADPWYWQPLVGYVLPDDEVFFYWGSGYNNAENSLAPPHWHITNGGPVGSFSDYDTVLTDGTMHHYAITYDADAQQMKMYLNGSPIATAGADLSNVVPDGDDGPILIGSHMGTSSYEVWHGLIDRVRFSDEVVAPQNFIPEPATLSLLALGGLGLIRRRHRM